ncbi:MAG: hypothetical protein AAF611_02385 [Bacteroidota bacterium]
MKKISFIPWVVIAFLAVISCAKKKSDLFLFGVQGNVKTYTENHFKAEQKFGDWQKGEPADFGNMKVDFNRNGNYESLEFLNKRNELQEKRIIKRENGEIVSELSYDDNGKLTGHMDITHSSDTKLKFVNFDTEGNKTSKGVSFMENGRIVKQDITLFSSYAGGERKKILVYFEYDEYGRMISQKQTRGDGEIEYHSIYKFTEFDENNNWTKRLDYSEDNSETPNKVVTRTYEYY